MAGYDGDRTLVPCDECEAEHPFRECRLFIVDGEYAFMCETCWQENLGEPLRRVIRERTSLDELEASAEASLRESVDPEEREGWTQLLLKLKMMKKYGEGGVPPRG